MRKLIVIGTIHGMTPEAELNKVLEKYAPAQLLVEIAHDDLTKDLSKYPVEMIYAYNWAKKKGIPVAGFDSKINELKEGLSLEYLKKVDSEEERLLKKFTWIDLNKEKNNKKTDTPLIKSIIDEKKARDREIEMLANIKKKLIAKGKILILTGCSHLAFFEEKLKDAQFPFRT